MSFWTEATLTSRLKSPVIGALSHALAVTGPAITADAAVIRLQRFRADGSEDPVLALSFAVDRPTAAELESWAADSGSLPARLNRLRQEGVFRPAPAHQPDLAPALYEPVRRHRMISDVLCVGMPVREPVRIAAVYLRYRPRPAFEDQSIGLLAAAAPSLVWVLLTGLQRATHVGPLGDETARPRSIDSLARLSRTERRVLDLLLEGRTERQAAEQIGRSPHTVHVHVKNIYRKLDVSSRRQLKAIAQRA